METRKTLEDEILSWLDESGDTDVVQANVRSALKQAHVTRLVENDWPFMKWFKPVTLNVVAGQSYYSLHSEYDRGIWFRNSTENQPLQERAKNNIIPTNVDEKNFFEIAGRSPIQNQPTAASVFTIVSDSTSDTGGSKGVYVRGETADGVLSETITPNGLTPVAGTLAFLPGAVLEVAKIGTWVGKMTMTSNAGAVTNLVLTAGENGRSYQQIHLLWTPTANFTLEYQFYRKPSPFNQDYTIPDIPEPYSRILVWDTLMMFAAYDGRLDESRILVWRGEQEKMDVAMRMAYQDALTYGAENAQIRDVEEQF